MDFVAFLVPKLWPNFRKLLEKSTLPPVGNIWNFFGIAFELKTLKSIKRSKDPCSILQSNEALSHEIGSFDRPMPS